MRNSKTTNSILSIVTAVVVLAIALFALGRALTPVEYSVYYNHDVQQADEKGESFDLVMVGTSTVYRTMSPTIFEEELGYERALNAGTSMQPIRGSYYIAKDLIQRYHPKTLIMSVSFSSITKNDDTLQKDLLTYDQIQDPMIKAEYALNVMQGNDFLYLLDAYRYRDSLSPSYILENYEKHQNLFDVDGKPVGKVKKDYLYRGYRPHKPALERGNVPIKEEGTFNPDVIDVKSVEYLEKIVQLCKDNDVELILVTGITSMMQLYNVEGYQEAIDFYTQFAKENGILYLDMNLVRDRLMLYPDEMLFDYNHLNKAGSQVFSKQLSDMINMIRRGEDVSPLFYANLDELKQDVDYVVAVKGVQTKEDAARILDVLSLQNPDVVPEYRVLTSSDGESFDVLFDYSQDSSFDISGLDKDSYVRVEARSQGSESDFEAFQEYKVK